MRIKQTFILLWAVMTSLAIQAQNDFSISYSNPDGLEVCGSDTLNVTLSNVTMDSLYGIELTVTLPNGIQYVENSILSDTTITVNASDNNVPSFTTPNLDSGASVSFAFLVEANCDLYDDINAGTIFQNIFTANHDGNNPTTNFSNPFSIATPLLVITNVDPQNGIVSVGDTITRTITIQNTRLGSLDNFIFSNTSSGSAVVLGTENGTITDQTNMGYTTLLNETDFVAIGDGDALFENNETITITEQIVITTCENGFSTFNAAWGCNDEVCQSDQVFANLIVDPNLANPDLLFLSQPVDETCYCGDTPTTQAMTIVNQGNATAYNITFSVLAVDSISGIDPLSINVSQSGVDIPYQITNSVDVSAPELIDCLNPAGTLEDMSILLDELAPGDSIHINWEMYYCIPFCNEIVSGWLYTHSYFEGCPANQETIGGINLSSNVASLSHDFNASTSSINEGDTISLNYQVDTEYLNHPEGFLHLQFNLSDRVIWDGDIASLELVGGETPSSFSYDEATGILEVFYDFPLTNASEFISIDAFISCGGGNVAVEIESVAVDAHIYLDDDCPTDGSCGIDPCTLAETFTVVCEVDPGNIGNICIYDYTFERMNTGLPDNNNDRIADETGEINFERIRQDRAITGDTIYEQIPAIMGTLGYTNMTEGFVRTTINNGVNQNNNEFLVSPIGIENISAVLTYIDISTGEKYVIENIPFIAQQTEFGNIDTLKIEYDINVNTLNGLGANLPPNFSFENGDSLLLENQYIVRQGRFHPSQKVDDIYASPYAEINNANDEKTGNACTAFFREMEITGFMMSIDMPNDFAVCNFSDRLVTMSQQIGGVHNFFPWEYRNFGFYSGATFYFNPEIASTFNPKELQIADINFNPTYSSNIAPVSISNNQAIYDIKTHIENNMDDGRIPDEEFVILLYHEAQAGCDETGLFEYETDVTYDASYLFNTPKPEQYLSRNGALTLNAGDSLYTIERDVTKTVYKPNLEFAVSGPTISSYNDDVEWLFDITNLSAYADMYNVWVEVESENGALDNFSVVNIVNEDTIQSTNNIFHLDSIPFGETMYLSLLGNYLTCDTENLKIRYGWGCEVYDGDISTACSLDSMTFTVVPEFPELEMDVTNPSSGADLCDTIDYHTIRVYNANRARAYDVVFQSYIPNGLSIASGTSQFSYNNTIFADVPDPVFNATTGFWEWDIQEYEPSIAQDGLAGVIDFPLNTFFIRFKLVSDCEIVANSYLVFNTTNENRCDDTQNSVAVAGDAISINGATTPYTTSIDVNIEPVDNCAEEIPINVAINKGSFIPVLQGDSVMITLPVGLSYTPESFNSIQNADMGEPTIQMVNSHVQLSWQMPVGFTFGTMSFEMTAQLENSYACANDIFLVQTVRPVELLCVATNEPCTVDIETGSDFESFQLENPVFEITNFTANLNTNATIALYDIDVQNSGLVSTVGEPIIVDLYIDTDYSGDLSEGDDYIKSETYNDTLFVDSTFSLNGFLVFPSNAASCNLMAVIDPSKHCDCGTNAQIVELSLNATSTIDTTVCGVSSIELGVRSQPSFIYDWDDDAGIACDDCPSTLIDLPMGNMNPMLSTYTLQEIRATGCVQDYIFNVTAYQIDDLIPTTDTLLCEGADWNITINIPVDSIWWTDGTDILAENTNDLSVNSFNDTITVNAYLNEGCFVTDTVFVGGSDFDGFYIPSQTTCGQDSISIEVFDNNTDTLITNNNYSYVWSPTTNLSCFDCPNPIFTGTDVQEYTLTIIENGCEYVNTVSVENLPTYFTEQDIFLCDGDDERPEYSDFRMMDTWCDTLVAQNGCDSIACMTIVRLDTFFTSEELFICNGESVDIFGNLETQAGLYEQVYIAENGCDSTHQIQLNIYDTFLEEQSISICQGESTDIFGNLETEANIYEQLLTTPNGCDSLIRIELIVLDVFETEEILTFCEGNSVSVFGNQITESGEFSETYTAANGCDSTHTITVEMLQNISSFTTVSTCAGTPINIFGNPEMESGIYEMNFTAANGCDSLATIELIVNDTFFNSEIIEICAGESIGIFGNLENESGIYTNSLQTVNGCDSILQVELIVNNNSIETETISICVGESVLIFGNEVTESGIFEETYTSVNGCDSLHRIALTVFEVYETEELITICEGDSVAIFDTFIQESGMYSEMYASINGCDSTHTIQVEVLPNSSFSDVISICAGDQQMVFGNPETEAGIYTETFISSNGCDSLVTIELVLLDTFYTFSAVELCPGDSTNVFGEWMTSSGMYTRVYDSQEGCDSIAQIQITMLPSSETQDTVYSCEGEILTIFGNEITSTQQVCETYSDTNGCDSIHCTYAIFEPNIFTEETLYICDGEELFVFDNFESEAGVYTETNTSTTGCDSTHTIILILNEPAYTESPIYICETDSLWLDGIYYEFTDDQMEIEHTYPAANGCDSIHTWFVLVNPSPEIIIMEEEVITVWAYNPQINLQTTGTPNVSYQWTNSDNYSCNDCPNPTLTVDNSGMYEVIVTDDFGCTAQDQIQINFIDGCISGLIEMPNAITPNGDGINDGFWIYKNEGLDELEYVRIWNRWGELVFETNDISQKWYGTHKGKSLNSGVYAYMIRGYCFNGEPYVAKGNVTILK